MKIYCLFSADVDPRTLAVIARVHDVNPKSIEVVHNRRPPTRGDELGDFIKRHRDGWVYLMNPESALLKAVPSGCALGFIKTRQDKDAQFGYIAQAIFHVSGGSAGKVWNAVTDGFPEFIENFKTLHHEEARGDAPSASHSLHAVDMAAPAVIEPQAEQSYYLGDGVRLVWRKGELPRIFGPRNREFELREKWNWHVPPWIPRGYNAVLRALNKLKYVPTRRR